MIGVYCKLLTVEFLIHNGVYIKFVGKMHEIFINHHLLFVAFFKEAHYCLKIQKQGVRQN